MATNFPSIIPSSISFGIKYNTQINISNLSGSVQTVELPGARWVADLSFDGLEPEESRVLASFLTSLRGSSGRFYLYDYSHPTHRGTGSAPGVITVNGAGQVGSSINTSGWNVSQTGVLLTGDYIQLENNEVKIVAADVNSDSSGNATITFNPPIRKTPSNSSTVAISACKAIMFLSNDENRWDSDNPGLITNIRLSCTEAF